jgi:sensor histidine kinase YesM
MTRYNFIFSDKLFHRITRHVVFWLVFSTHIVLFRYYVFDLKYLTYASTYLIRLHNLLLFLPVSFFYAYFALYFLLPQFILKERYVMLIIIVLLLSILLLLFSYDVSTRFDIRLAWDVPLNRASIIRQADFTVNNGVVFPLTVSTFAIGIKMAKKFYLQQKQNELLAKQKIKAEVQMLKSQVHPRFLFHSLNSIYYSMLNGSEQSPAMLLKLSDLLSYILYESDERLVPLEKELALLQNYIDLEKASRGNRLIVNAANEINTNEKFIAPLLLLPLGESLFEETDKNKQRRHSLNIYMLMKEDRFLCELVMSGYEKVIGSSFTENMELMQVKKRLQVLYTDKHDFKIAIKNNSITISLSLLLDNKM